MIYVEKSWFGVVWSMSVANGASTDLLNLVGVFLDCLKSEGD